MTIARGKLSMNKIEWLSERMVFGLLIIVGYFAIVGGTMFIPAASQANAKDALLVIGPLLGTIVSAIWKTDKADKQNAETVNTLASAVVTAQALPATPEVKT